MIAPTLAVIGLTATALVVVLFVRRGRRWGATPEERALEFAADRFLGPRRGTCAVMTRAISIGAPPETVWPWLRQMARGGGFYSYDWLDNGGKASARHLVSWIPEPQLGDAVAFGYLRLLQPGRDLVYWVEQCRWIGTTWRGAFQYHLQPENGGSRLVVRVAAEARGLVAGPAMWFFQSVDFIMMRRQLLGLRDRAEQFGTRREDPANSETGARDQYQEPVAIYASGERAGTSGEAGVARWRQDAMAAGVLDAPQAQE